MIHAFHEAILKKMDTMNLFEMLISFLEKKASDINEQHRDTAIDVKEDPIFGCSVLNTEIKKHNERQARIRNVLHVLFALIELKKESQLRFGEITETELEGFFESMIQLIVDRQSVFDNTHPLFGFQPFHERLIAFYAAQECFEECSEIQRMGVK